MVIGSRGLLTDQWRSDEAISAPYTMRVLPILDDTLITAAIDLRQRDKKRFQYDCKGYLMATRRPLLSSDGRTNRNYEMEP